MLNQLSIVVCICFLLEILGFPNAFHCICHTVSYFFYYFLENIFKEM